MQHAIKRANSLMLGHDWTAVCVHAACPRPDALKQPTYCSQHTAANRLLHVLLQDPASICTAIHTGTATDPYTQISNLQQHGVQVCHDINLLYNVCFVPSTVSLLISNVPCYCYCSSSHVHAASESVYCQKEQ
jgi:hypothetical protein